MEGKLKVIVSGAKGRMGRTIARLIGESDDLVVSGEAEAGCPLESVIKAGDVVIDFSVHNASAENASISAKYRKPIVVGTTGLSVEEEQLVKEAGKKIPIVYAPNMSVGVNLMWKLAGDATRVLNKNYQIDITEEHHIHKLDRPSGTAKEILNIVMDAGGFRRDEDLLIYEETAPEGMRRKVTLGSFRKGETVGNHTIRFTGQRESLEITHRAFTRDVFAEGALTAARWIVGKTPGLYDMSDVLSIK